MREKLLAIISGQRNGFFQSLIRCGLGCLTPIYRCAIGYRNWRFDRAEKKLFVAGSKHVQHQSLIRRVDVPVISIGNVTTGGTGKTPLVIWATQFLQTQNRSVVIISRGYRTINNEAHHSNTTGNVSVHDENPSREPRNDEAIELAARLPGVPHLQHADRYSIAQTAIEQYQPDIILLDDGFQHRQLHRELDIVLIDATNPFGYERLLPRGLLREPIVNLRRAAAIVITRVDLIDDAARKKIFDRVTSINQTSVIAETKTTTQGWLQTNGRQLPLEHFGNQPVFACCAIGNPGSFLRTLERMGMNVVGRRIFADHHHFTETDQQSLLAAAESSGAKALLCTHKDLVKLETFDQNPIPIAALLIDIEFISGQQPLEQLILGIFAHVGSVASPNAV